jgi:2-dehydropantoate 2-reductase
MMYLCMKFMKYGIIGTGAIGGFYGGKLAKAGLDVHFLLHSDYDYVKKNGLQIDSCDGSFHLDHVNVYQNAADMPVCDVVLVSLKTVNNHLLRDLLPPLIHEQSVVVMIQNGIGVEPDVQAMFPGLQLVAGLAFICSAKTEPGRVNHQCYGSINLADYSCRDEACMRRLLDDFISAGINTHQVEYHEARWKKAVWNMPFNGLTVALNTSTDKLLRNPVTRQLVRDLMMEVIGAARHLGVRNLDASFAEKMLTTTDVMVPYSPSMKLDFDFHRPMEIEYLYSRPIEEARKAGYPMPKLEMLEAELRFLAVNTGGCPSA